MKASGHVIVRRHRRGAGVDQRTEMAVRLRANRDALLGQRATADDAVHAFARQRHTHGSANQSCRRGAQDLVVRQALAAEATADVGREHAHLLGLEIKSSRRSSLLGGDHLRRVMNGEIVTIPYDRRCMRLNRVVIVPRRAIDMVDLVGRCREQLPRHRRSRSTALAKE